ncbi:hypothetical protein SK128_004615, partial [Halocaridina rubra]
KVLHPSPAPLYPVSEEFAALKDCKNAKKIMEKANAIDTDNYIPFCSTPENKATATPSSSASDMVCSRSSCSISSCSSPLSSPNMSAVR